MKYADSVQKGFAASASTVISNILDEIMLNDSSLGISFLLGIVVVAVDCCIYFVYINSNNYGGIDNYGGYELVSSVNDVSGIHTLDRSNINSKGHFANESANGSTETDTKNDLAVEKGDVSQFTLFLNRLLVRFHTGSNVPQ